MDSHLDNHIIVRSLIFNKTNKGANAIKTTYVLVGAIMINIRYMYSVEFNVV